MTDERLDRSLDRLKELAQSIRDMRQDKWLTTPCDALVSTTIKSDRAPTMEVIIGWLCPPQLARELDGELFPFGQLKHLELTKEQKEVLKPVEQLLEDVWCDQLIKALPTETYTWMLDIIDKISADPEGLKFKCWYPTDTVTVEWLGDTMRLTGGAYLSEDYEMWRKGIVPFINYKVREILNERSAGHRSDIDDAGAGVGTGAGIVQSRTTSDERGDYEMCDDDRIRKLEYRLEALEKMAGELYGRTHQNRSAIEAFTADEIREREKKHTITITREDLEKYGSYEVPISAGCYIGENCWLDDLNQQLIAIGRTPQSEKMQIFRIYFGGVGREATEVLLYTRGLELRICLPGETFLKTIDEVYKLLDAGKLCQKAYWKLLLDTLKSWRDTVSRMVCEEVLKEVARYEKRKEFEDCRSGV